MARAGPRTVHTCSDEFKLAAVRSSHEPGIHVKTVAAALAIHPFMFSNWRTEVRDRVRRAPRHPSALQSPVATIAKSRDYLA